MIAAKFGKMNLTATLFRWVPAFISLPFMARMKVALIGAGYIAQEAHMRILAESRKAELTLVVDPSEQALAEASKRFPQAKNFESLERAELAGINCAIIASPSSCHYSQAKYLLEKGIHVLCEKPLALNHAHAKEIAELSLRNGLVLQAGFNRRFQPVASYILDALSTGKYGKLNNVTIRAGWIAKDLPPGILNRSLSGGGILMDYAVHYIDRLCSWFPVLDVSSYADDSRGGIESNAVVKLEGATSLGHRAQVSMFLSWTNEMGDTIILDFENI